MRKEKKPYDASNDTGDVERQESDMEDERKTELKDILGLLSTHEGTRFFRRLFKSGHLWTTTFTGNSKGMFLEGERNLALKFFGDVMEVAPDRIQDLILLSTEDKNG